MRIGFNSRAIATVAVAFIGGVALSPVLSGCVPDDSALSRAVESMRGYSYSLPPGAQKELSRFNQVYGTYASNAEDTRELKHFKDAYLRVRADYLHEIPDTELIDSAIDGVHAMDTQSALSEDVVEAALDAMVASLDPHSTYLNAEELKETFISTRGQFGGLGIEVTMEDDFVRVVSPIEGTPAYRAGLKSGDLITHLDGKSIAGLTIMDAVKIMRGKPGTDIRLSVRREGVDPFDVTITRAVITVQAVRWHREGNVGYIRVASFTEQAKDGLHRAVGELKSEIGPGLEGFVLDLRNNPGGLLDQSLAVADAFLEDGRIVSVRGRDAKREQIFWAEAGDLAVGRPVLVLINSGSASASEIVASALQEGGRATVMGQRSFGKGSVQTITPLPVQGALKLTTALYLTPEGHAIQARGVIPDIVVNGKAGPDRQRESDLPGALAASEATVGPRLGHIEEDDCPAAGEDGDDRLLGCALEFLKLGSAEKFLASFAGGSRI